MQQAAWRSYSVSIRGQVAALFIIVGVLVPLVGCSKNNSGYVYDDAAPKKRSKRGQPDSMYGKVVDRNDKPLSRVTITIEPGQVERISNKWGEYDIEYLFSDDGERLSLKKNQDYSISAWKAGFHESAQIFRFSGGKSEIPAITLIEDTIALTPENILDPSTINPDNVVDGDGVGHSFEK